MRCRVVISLLLLCLAVSCEKAPSGKEEALSPELTVLIGTDGFGDGCYNDTMLSGILAFCKEHSDVRLTLRQPSSIDDAGRILDDWLAQDSPKERALLLASNSYKPILRGKPASGNGRVLIMETDESFPGHSSYIIRRYGASWLCGVMSRFFSPIILKAMEGNDMIDESARGFVEGYRTASDETPLSWTLAKGPEGFAMRDSTYRFVYKNLNELYNQGYPGGRILFFPLLGGSLPGLFDYSRYQGFVCIAGMDVDCTAYDPQVVPYSLCINNHLVLKNYLEDWLAGKPWPEHAQFGLGSDYVEVAVNPAFNYGNQDMEALYKEFYARAVEKEEAYEVE